MYVCLCKGITDTQIRAAIEDGVDSMLRYWNDADQTEESLNTAIATITKHGETLQKIFVALQDAIDTITEADEDSLDIKDLSAALLALQAELRESAEDFYLSLSELSKRKD